MSQETVTCSGLFKISETEKAIGVGTEEGGKILCWLAKSLIEEEDLTYQKEGSVEIPEWLADREELNYE